MNNKFLASIIAAVIPATGPLTAGQSLLNAGDIVFLAANSDDPDTFAFAPLVNIEAGTVIHFTDNSRTGTGTGFADWRKESSGALGESPNFTWVAPSAITAGTKVSVSSSAHGMGLANAGETLFAFQGDIYNPRFISAVGWTSTDSFITSGAVDANKSYLPSSLNLGTNAVEIAINTDNTAYNGGTSGTSSALRTAVNNASNWITNETTVQAGPASLTVSDAANAPAAAKQLGGYGFGPATASYTESPVVAMANTTLSNFGFNGAGTKDVDGANTLVGQGFAVAGGWSTAAFNVASQYFGFTLAVAPGYDLDLIDFGFAYQSSGNITLGAFYSTDGFATYEQLGLNIGITDTNVGASSLTNLDISGLEGTVEFRIYGFNAATGSGTLEVDEVWLQGGASPVPEPAAALLGGMGVLTLLRRRRH